jgi:hypothetical protein
LAQIARGPQQCPLPFSCEICIVAGHRIEADKENVAKNITSTTQSFLPIKTDMKQHKIQESIVEDKECQNIIRSYTIGNILKETTPGYLLKKKKKKLS